MSSTLRDDLAKHESAWRSKPLLRRIYRDWYELIAARLATIPGPTIELGAGIARFKEVVPSAVATDIEPTPWADRAVNAEQLDYADASVANLVLIDVFHHLARPTRFLDEADRVLRDRGRIIMLEPYCSTLSTFAYTHFHHEDIDLAAAPFADDPSLDGSPMTANGARPTLVFFRHDCEWRERWPRLRLVERRRLAFFVYPLSGGFSRPSLLPAAAYRPLTHVERWLQPLARFLAFRCLVVIERTPETTQRP
jgi:SAM-dependent methyltransferase